MNARMLSCLELKMEHFINENCEENDWPIQVFIHPTLNQQMAKAAMMVFEASVDGQDYAAHEGA